MRTFFLSLILMGSVGTWAQTHCSFTDRYTVIAPSGLRMRAEPNASSAVVVGVPKDSVVQACGESFAVETIENIPGNWIRVKYKSKVGYMFDGFLARLVEPTHMEMSYRIDTIDGVPDSTKILISGTDTIENPGFIWIRTQRDSIPSTGRLDAQQVKALASVLRDVDIRMDSIIAVLHKLPTLGSQDSLIAWIAAGRPPVYRIRRGQPAESKPKPHAEEEAKIEFQLATEAFNYCGDINKINPGLNWYGIFPEGNGYVLRRTELEIVVSRHRLGKSMEFDIRNTREASAHFLFGVNRRLDTAGIYELNPDYFSRYPAKLFPGQQFEAFSQSRNGMGYTVYISATGAVIEVGRCPVIENYKLKINTDSPAGEIRQDITPFFETLGDCGMPDMYWFGDLNGDSYPELVYVAPDDIKNVFTLLISNGDNPEALYSVGSVWTLEKCEE